MLVAKAGNGTGEGCFDVLMSPDEPTGYLPRKLEEARVRLNLHFSSKQYNLG